jgi:hypothetical protein
MKKRWKGITLLRKGQGKGNKEGELKDQDYL